MAAERILITGGEWFIGSHLVERVKQEKPESTIMIIDSHVRTLPENKRKVRSILGTDDVQHRCDLTGEKARKIIWEFAPDRIFHLAAQISIVRSFQDPQGTIQANILAIQNMLDALGDVWKKDTHILFPSSGGSVYGNTHTIPTPEFTGTSPKSPYAYSKVAGEELLKMYHELGHIWFLTILRLSNVYGPRQNTADSASVIQTAIGKAQKDEPFHLIWDTTNTRDYIHVDDVISAFMMSMNKRVSGTFNIGTGVETSVDNILMMVERVSGKTIQRDTSRVWEWKNLLARSCLAIQKAKDRLWWKPQMTLEQGIWTVWNELTP